MNTDTGKTIGARLRHFMHLEATGGFILIAAAFLAIIAANSDGAHLYSLFQDNTRHAINDGLMVVFFFLVGLEIRRETISGSLSTRDRALLPFIAALGGMLVPAAIFITVNAAHPENLHGWAIPSATDIAFALGLLALLGSRVPASVRVFLLAIAVIDDLGAIIIIALFYTAQLSLPALAAAAFFIAVMAMLRRQGIQRAWPFLLAGFALWLSVLESGVHATLAGVITAFFVPEKKIQPAIDRLHAWVAFFIMPLFAFANAGVPLQGLSPANLLAPLPLGILLGLFTGKQAGVFCATWLAIRLRLSSMPAGMGWRHVYGTAIFCGIGFTMSLFIGTLAFDDAARLEEIRLGVLSGTLLSSLFGLFFFIFCQGKKQ